LAKEHQIHSIAFPSISTGAYGFPVERACKIAVSQIKSFLERNAIPEKVVIVCFDQITYQSYLNTFKAN
jgi:O-acetyl-ADP-ribose deacetylase (regulator of RNase III)